MANAFDKTDPAYRLKRKPKKRTTRPRIGNAVFTGRPLDEIAGFETYPVLAQMPAGIAMGQVHLWECCWYSGVDRFGHQDKVLKYVNDGPRLMQRIEQRWLPPAFVRGSRRFFIAFTEVFEPSVDLCTVGRALQRAKASEVNAIVSYLALEWVRAFLPFSNDARNRGSARLRVTPEGRTVALIGPPTIYWTELVDQPMHTQLDWRACVENIALLITRGRAWRERLRFHLTQIEDTLQAVPSVFAALRGLIDEETLNRMLAHERSAGDRLQRAAQKSLAALLADADVFPLLNEADRAARFDECAEQSVEYGESFNVDAFLMEFGLEPDRGGMVEKNALEIAVDRRAVTRAEYRHFLEQTGRAERIGPQRHDTRRDQEPVTNVSWDDAYEYAVWAGKRLPTTDEWRAATHGLQHSGVWEWTATTRLDGHVVHGGAWRNQPNTPSSRDNVSWESKRAADVGFRCVRDINSSVRK